MPHPAPNLRRAAALTALLASLPAAASAGPPAPLEEGDRLPVVQNRIYRVEHEFTLGVGALPADAYAKGLTVSGGYTWHVDDLFGIEARFVWSQNFKTALRNKLERNFGVASERFAELGYYGTAGVVFTPIYGKLALFNRLPVHGEIFLTAALVAGRMRGGEPTGGEPGGKGARLAIGGAPGFGLRAYLHRHVSLRLDFRFPVLYSAGEVHFPLSIALGVSFSTRSEAR